VYLVVCLHACFFVPNSPFRIGLIFALRPRNYFSDPYDRLSVRWFHDPLSKRMPDLSPTGPVTVCGATFLSLLYFLRICCLPHADDAACTRGPFPRRFLFATHNPYASLQSRVMLNFIFFGSDRSFFRTLRAKYHHVCLTPLLPRVGTFGASGPLTPSRTNILASAHTSALCLFETKILILAPSDDTSRRAVRFIEDSTRSLPPFRSVFPSIAALRPHSLQHDCILAHYSVGPFP